MKRLFAIVLGLFSLITVGFAINQPNVGDQMTQQSVGSFYPIQSCVDGQTVYVTKNYYVGDTFSLYDTHWGDASNYAYIYDTSSKVMVADPYGVFSFNDVFRFKSNGKPVGVYEVKFVENSGSFLPGTLSTQTPNVNNGALVAQIAFNLHRQWFHTVGGSASYSIGYWPMPNGPQSSTSFSDYYEGNYSDGLECYNYVVHYCGDGDVDTAQSIAVLPGGNNNSVANEQCDPADPTHQGWGDLGCSDSCVPVNQGLEAPTCDLDVIDMGNDVYNVNWDIDGEFNSPANISLTPPLANQTNYTVNTNNGIWTNIIPTGDGTFTVSMTVTNDAGSNSCHDTFYIEPLPDAPTCNLDANLTSDGSYDVTWNIDGIFNSPTNISLTPPLANQTNYTVNTNNGIWTNIIPTGDGTFTVSMTVTNDGGSNSCHDTFYIEQPEDHVCGDGNIDWPNTVGVYEECDNGPSFGYGCAADCTLMTPTCDLDADVQFQLIGNPVTFTAVKNAWSDYTSFNLGNSIFGQANIIYGNSIIFPYEYTYQNVQTYTQVLTVENNLVPIAPGVVRPTAMCTESVNVVNGCEIEIEPQIITLGDIAEISWTIWPDFNLPDYMEVFPALVGAWPHNIYNKTGNVFVGPNINSAGEYVFTIDAWTINGYEFSCTNTLYVDVDPVYGHLDIDKILLTTGQMLPGDFVDYRIELTNDGEGVYDDAYISDVMPASLDLIYTNLVGVYPYTSAEWQDTAGNWFFEYSGFDLSPGQTVYVNVRGQVREGSSVNDTTNCAFTSGDYDCEIYGLGSDPYILKSQRMSNGAILTDFTTGVINVNVGDYISYRVDFANHGGENTDGGVRVVDHMPLCIDYVSASIHGVSSASFIQTQDINGRWFLEYNNFDLDAGQAGYMVITGQVMDGGVCDTIDTYVNNSYIYFHNPLVVMQSNTTAFRSNHSIVNVTKGSDVDIHLPGDDKLFIIQVENFGPNPISNIVLDDIWPTGTCINYVNWTGVGFTKDPLSLTWSYATILQANDSITLYIDANITNNVMCVNPSYENIVNLTYTEMGIDYQDQAIYHFAVTEAPLANISLMKTANVASVSSGDTIIYTITYQNMGNTTLNSYVITDYWPGMVDFVSATPFPSSVVNLETGSILQWNFYTPLIPGQTGEIVLEGTVY